jgi:hypothetical protein
MAAADNLITLRDSNGRVAARRLIEMLARADRDVSFRLRAAQKHRGGPKASFTEASLLAYREQIQKVIEFAKDRLRGLTSDEALRVAGTGYGMTRDLFSSLETAFTGVTVPVRLREAAILELKQTLLQRHLSSADRYGETMTRQMNRILAQGMVQGKSQSQVVDDLVRIRGPQGVVSLKAMEVQPGMIVRVSEEIIPEGLFVRYRSWAWRIVRTETAEAQNAAHVQAIGQFRDQFPDVKKKILATFDKRTAWDSVAVHGQVRSIDKPFMDGAGRVYQRPPARPNDREVVVPWRTSWPNTEHSQPPTYEQLQRLRQLNSKERVTGRAMATAERRVQSSDRRIAIAIARPPSTPRMVR